MAQFHEHRQSPQWKKARSAAKIVGACQEVVDSTDGEIKYLWMDTVCIKQDNQTELSTVINSMYRLYRDAEVCYVYLHDFLSTEEQTLGQSDWFTRGWTLQELLAPPTVNFFDKEWEYLGERWDLKEQLSSLTGIDPDYLTDVRFASISARMSWMAGRKTTVPEDTAYCLLGLFDVNMPLLYGEGKERAFLRLQEEIMKYSDDRTLFVWKKEDQRPVGTTCGSTKVDEASQKHLDVHTETTRRTSTVLYNTGLLANSPDCFRSTGHYRPYDDSQNTKPYQMTNKGIAIDLRLWFLRDGNRLLEDRFIAALDCHDHYNEHVGIYLEKIGEGCWSRIWPEKIVRLKEPHQGELQSLYVKKRGPTLKLTLVRSSVNSSYDTDSPAGKERLERLHHFLRSKGLTHQIEDDLLRTDSVSME
ncbi:MAG: hypothetical protein L6R42_003706 [Xanthoria sp. 1 TBL-2021]|nr:MAG: hypothetical protein L6R42_003706 [Xanthoria sp. 1 TBL-2021]